MKLSLFTKIGMAAVGVMFVGWLVLTLATGGDAKKTGPTVVDDKHCPVCGRELPLSAQQTGVCPYCQIEGRTGAMPGRGGRAAGGSPVIPVLLVVTFIALLAVHLFMTVRTRVVKPQEQLLYHLNCPKCGRKLRYRESQVGKLARCPLCHRPIVFPKPPIAAPPGRWGQVRRWLKLA